MVFCEGDKEIQKFNDIGYAMKCQEEYHTELENDLLDFILDQKKKIESAWNNEKYESKINYIKQSEWTKIQKQFKPKPSF